MKFTEYKCGLKKWF